MTARVPVHRAGVAHEVEDARTVLHDDARRQIMILNEVGAASWYLMDGRRSVADIAQTIAAAVGQDPAQVERDVETFFRDLEAQGLVELR